MPLFFFFLLSAAPIFAQPLTERLADSLSFADIPVWYVREQGEGTQILAGTQSFSFPKTRPQSFFADFPYQDFLHGHIYNKINKQTRTNFVFIRKDQIQSQWFDAGTTLIVFKESYAKNPPDRIRINRIIKPRFRIRGGF